MYRGSQVDVCTRMQNLTSEPSVIIIQNSCSILTNNIFEILDCIGTNFALSIRKSIIIVIFSFNQVSYSISPRTPSEAILRTYNAHENTQRRVAFTTRGFISQAVHEPL